MVTEAKARTPEARAEDTKGEVDTVKSKDDAKALIAKWGLRAGLDEDGIRKLQSNDEILAEAAQQLTMHDEMAAAIDKTRNEARAEIKKYEDWYGTESKKVEQLGREWQQYRDTYGELPNGNGNGNGAPPRNENGQFVSRKDLDAVGLSAVQVGKQMAFITSDYNARFSSKFGPMSWEQVEEFEKFAVSRGIPPVQAYREWVKPKEDQLATERQEAEKQGWEAKIKAAREEGLREGRTRQNWNNEATRTTDSFGRDLKALEMPEKDADKAGDQAFLDAWNEYDAQHANATR